MSENAEAGAPPASPRPLFSDGYKNAVLTLLVIAYTFNFIDRTIIATIAQAIKVDLKITDAQVGLLGGISFALLYTVLGIPIARLAERWNRVSIIAVSMVVWSGFTVACGAAGSFVQLLALRVGVGVGEAGCSPPAHSLISDYYEPKKRASALSIYAFGIPLGSMIGAAAGGWLAQSFGWRIAFMIVGAPGILVALLIKLAVKEPPRGHSDPAQRIRTAETARSADTPASAQSWLKYEVAELASVTKSLFGHWPVLNMVLGITIASFAGYGVGLFAPPYFNRAYGLDYATVGLIFGVIGGFSAGLGTLAGGFIADWASRHGARWYSLTPAIGLAIATPIYLLAYTRSDWRTAALILLLPGIFHYTYLGPTFGVVQNVVETRRRATATAVLFLFLNLVALGGGTAFTGWIIDHFAASQFGHGGTAGFAHFCPGGVAAKGAATALAGQCKSALIGGTRAGILVTTGFYGWAAIHYFLGCIGLARRLEVVAAERRALEA